MTLLNELESTLTKKNATMLPDVYKDDIDVHMLGHEFALFKEPLNTIKDAVHALQKMHSVKCSIFTLIRRGSV